MRIVNHLSDGIGFHPVRPDGSQWPHVLWLPDGAAVYADSAREVLEELIEGYATAGTDELRRDARVRHAHDQAARHQDLRIAQALADGLISRDDADDLALTRLLHQIGGRAIGLADPEHPTAPPRWEAAVRLVCVTTAYAPYGELPLPQGHVDVLDPAGEEDYLLSLRRAGVLDYWSESVYA